MDSTLRRQLLAINRRFYAEHAGTFGASRRWPWPGWTRLVDDWLACCRTDSTPLRVFDVGCGNGRFGAFLLAHLAERAPSRRVHYLAVDAEPALVDQARVALEPFAEAGHRLEYGVLDLEEALPSEWSRAHPGAGSGFDLVVLFGVLHHVPGRARRLALVDDLGKCLAPGPALGPGSENRPLEQANDPRGVKCLAPARVFENTGLTHGKSADGRLAVSRWMLHQRPRFERKQRPFSQLDPPLDPSLLEPGDTLLGWQHDPTALRYLAFPDADELALLDHRPHLELLDTYRADGRSGEDNRYWIWRPRSPVEGGGGTGDDGTGGDEPARRKTRQAGQAS